MKTCLTLFFVVLTFVSCTASVPEEDPQSVIEGKAFVEHELQYFLQDILDKTKSVDKYFENYLNHLKIIQNNNQELVKNYNGIVNGMKKMLESLDEDYSELLVLKDSANSFYEKSFKNYYLTGHAMKWIRVRKQRLEAGPLRMAMFESYLDLESTQIIMRCTAVTPRIQVNSLIKKLIEKKETEDNMENIRIKEIITKNIEILEADLCNPNKYSEATGNAIKIIVEQTNK